MAKVPKTKVVPEEQVKKVKIKEIENTSITNLQQPQLVVKIKRLKKEAVVPTYIENGSAGLDITCINWEYDKETKTYCYYTGLAMEIPEGYVGLLFPKSGIYKKEISLTNCVGVVDSSYRGEIMARFRSEKQVYYRTFLDKIKNFFRSIYGMDKTFHYTNLLNSDEMYDDNDKICQLLIIPYPKVRFAEVSELSKTERGGKGFGEMTESKK